MKKLIYSILLISVIISACNKIETDDLFQKNDVKNDVLIYQVGIKSAQILAMAVTNSTSANLQNKVANIEPILYKGDTLLFIVNFENKGGWLLISGDKRTEPVLASEEKGTFTINKLPNGVAIWLDDIAEKIYKLKQSDIIDTLSVNYKIWSNIEKSIYKGSKQKNALLPQPGDALVRVLINVSSTSLPSQQVGPLVPTKWGQGDQYTQWNLCVPFGENGYRCPVGCTAVATAQLMYYYNRTQGKPSWMYSQGSCVGYSWDGYKNYSFSFSNASSDVWNLMPTYYDYSDNIYYVDILLGFIGWKLNMGYANGGSGANSEDVPGLLSQFGISSSYQGYDYNKVMTDLNNNKPVYTRADGDRDNHTFLGIHLYYTYGSGHAWLIDGYEIRRTKYTYTYQWQRSDGGGPLLAYSKQKSASLYPGEHYEGEIETEEYVSSTNYFIMNWGWDGQFDYGRFLANGAWQPSNKNFQWRKSIISDLSF